MTAQVFIVAKYVGHMNCSTCGYVYITDPMSVTIWFALDNKEQLCETTCPKCKQIRSSRIGLDDFVALRTHGVQVKPLGEKFEKLTEEMIDKWDSQKEFASDGFKRII
jgi:hypothetical protein